ncbi:hypothetical protein [Endozoicomonas sp. SCSIO W0465]|uniref:hypothetical protein n=1 Tax=Endozoicomonas sp. SCSIO W0465 TaxID=2918516 RepID=UPI0020752E44|nr:hypothetical protein [Endozoicomonas sp. SCSIO W0465]USE34387.1 hypothetical protein MJO57_19825 [Endozoicomonas sp. SCSIO W0465]
MSTLRIALKVNILFDYGEYYGKSGRYSQAQALDNPHKDLLEDLKRFKQLHVDGLEKLAFGLDDLSASISS